MQVDTSERHHARLLEAILLGVSDPILIFDPDWQLTRANDAAHRLLPLAVSSTTPEAIFESDAFAQALRAGSLPNEWQTKTEEYTFVPRLITQTEEDTARVERYVLILKDVSAYKRLNHNQNEFVHIVSHDLRSPLTTIKGYTSMMTMAGGLNPKQKDYASRVMSGIQQLTNLVDNIQDAGRFDIETGFYVMQRSYCDLTEIVRRVVGSYLIPAEKQELTLGIEIAPDVPIINADANMLERALTNLVDNAVKYTPNGGKVVVRVLQEEDHLVLSVSDTGFGIEPEDQKKLFHRHSRIAREEHKRIKGTGLGLFIVKSVAQRHGGDVWVESVVNTGSTFGLHIPLEGANLIFGSTTSS